MTSEVPPGRLDRPVDDARDHILGSNAAPITLVEYGSYACPHCRAANERIAEVRSELGERLRYVFRHRPIPGNALALSAAELVETAANHAQFWDAHVTLMTRSDTLTQEDLDVVAAGLAAARCEPADTAAATRKRSEAALPHETAPLSPALADVVLEAAQARVASDIDSAAASGVLFTPGFFINGRRYDGPWDESSFTDAMLGTLGYRVRVAALSFASWAPATGVLLLLATVLALLIANSPAGPDFEAFWQTELGFALGDFGFAMSLGHWINDALLTVFFLVVGLEIKRELTVGHLASRRAAALPIAAALGGMLLPAIVYLLVIPAGPWQRGWGVPMATDTAFAIALIAMLGRRVPIELRIFLTAAAIVDDIGAIIVVAIFYSGEIAPAWLGAAALLTGLLVLLNRSGVYRVSPYLLVGIALWATVHEGGLHATLAGVILAATIPTRPPPDYRTLALQADSILSTEARHGGEHLRHGPSETSLRALDDIHDRLLAPADRLLRSVAPRSSFVVLPLFALANAGVALSSEVFAGHGALMLAIVAGLAIGKPLGFVLLAWIAVRLGFAAKPDAYDWRQLAGAGALAGIGFTMSLFIAGQSFPGSADFAAAKIGVFAASALAAAAGVALLLRPADRP